MSSSRMSRAALAFAGAATAVAGAAVYLVVGFLGHLAETEAERPGVELVEVVVATRPLYQGVAITMADLDVVRLPVDALPVMTTKDDPTTVVSAPVFAAREQLVGQVPRERILATEIVRPERLADGRAGVGLNAVIPRGMRAISVGLEGADAVSGFLEPGHYVDVLVTMADDLGRPRTDTLLEAVFVLGVNGRAQNEGSDAVARRGRQRPSVTFLATESQAEDLAFASELGAMSLSLRNVQDVGYRGVSAITEIFEPRWTVPEALPRIEAPTAAPPTPTPGGSVILIRGKTVEEIPLSEAP